MSQVRLTAPLSPEPARRTSEPKNGRRRQAIQERLESAAQTARAPAPATFRILPLGA